MKIALWSLTTILSVLSVAGSWQIVTVDSNGYVGNANSLCLNASGFPCIAYSDVTYCNLKYAFWNGSSWELESVDMGVGQNPGPSLRLDSTGYPHIAYTSGDNLRYAQWNGSAWLITESVDPGSSPKDPSLDLDASGHPHIAFLDETDDDLKYAHWDGASWQVAVVDSEGDVGYLPSLKLDDSGYAHISYCGISPGPDCALRYAHWNGSSWDTEIVDNENWVGWYSSLSLDTMGYPHISYGLVDLGFSALKYASWDGNSWTIEIVDESVDETVGCNTCLALDDQEEPRISYITGYSTLCYGELDDQSWDITSVAPAGEGETSLVLDSFNNPHIAFWYGEDAELRYAYYLPNGVEEDLLSPESVVHLSVMPNPFASFTNVRFTLMQSGPVTLNVYDPSGRLLETLEEGEMAAGGHSVEIDGSVLSSGIYLIRLQSGSESAMTRVVLVR